MRVLVVEDEKQIAGFVRKGLEEQGFKVDLSYNGDEGYELAKTHPYDVIVLDIMLPGRDGLSIVSNLRKQRNTVPVILLTARSELDERVEGLDAGADDYLTKPFYVEELVARIRAVTRRRDGDAGNVVKVADLTLDLLSREAQRNGRKIKLTAREFDLLAYLMRSPGRVYTRTQILEHVWGFNFDPETNLVDVHIQRLRKKVSTGGEPQLIETVRGVGYRMVKDES
jgi:two-component system, OmpR family, response regulator